MPGSIQQSQADEALKARLAEALKGRAITETKLRNAKGRLRRVGEALGIDDLKW